MAIKFNFTLQKVLDHREIKMDLAKKDYLEAQAFLAAEQKMLEDMIEAKRRSLAERSSLAGQTTGWQASVNQINNFITGQDLRIANQNERLLKIEKVVESRREILKDALTEVKIMERLKEKKKADFLQEVRQKEAKELDEISSTRFVRTTKE
ncbi:flagellar export protein FliJ [Bdellovibrio sp. qaytius]|nr:flagellar export protein FliJ [Bdellovibrio sp. qaytius]